MPHKSAGGLSQVPGVGTVHPPASLGWGWGRLMGWMGEGKDRSRRDRVASHFGEPRPCPGLVLRVPRP